MTYAHVRNNQIIDITVLKYLDEDILNIEVSDDIANAYNNDTSKVIYQDGEVVFNSDYESEQLAKLKTDKLSEVNQQAYEYENNGLISYDGINPNGENVTVQIETSDKNIGKINGLINMFNAEKITQYIWSAKDDTQFVIKKDDAYSLSGLFAEFSSKIWLEKQPYFKNLVEQAKTIEELNAINIDYN